MPSPLIIWCYLSLLGFGVLDNLRGPFLSGILSDLHLSESQGAYYFALNSMCASLAGYKGQPILKRLGPAGMLMAGALLMGLGFMLMGWSKDFFDLMVAASVLGVGIGWSGYAQNVTVAYLSPPNKLNQFMSGLHSVYGVAATASPYLAFLMMSWSWNWRQSFFASGWIPIVVCLLFWRDRRFRIEELKDEKVSRPSRAVFWHSLILSGAISLYLLAEISVGTRLVRYLEVRHAVPAVRGSLWLLAFFAGLALARFAGLLWPTRSLQRLLFILLLGSAVMAILALTLLPQLFLALGLSMGLVYPFGIAYVRERMGEHTSYALSLVLGVGSATVVGMHILIGQISEMFSLAAAMWIGPVGLLAAAGALFLERQMGRV